MILGMDRETERDRKRGSDFRHGSRDRERQKERK